MSTLGGLKSSGFTGKQLTADTPRSLLERGGTAIFDVLDAPGNATRSLVGSITNQDPDLLLNAFKSLIPFAGSREVSGIEALGDLLPSDLSAGQEFVADVLPRFFLDPLFVFSGVTRLTTVGKAANTLRQAKTSVKTLRTLQRIENKAGLIGNLKKQERIFAIRTALSEGKEARFIERIGKGLKLTAKEKTKLKTFDTSGLTPVERSIVSLDVPIISARTGKLKADFGDYNKLLEYAKKINPLPDPRLEGLQKSVVAAQKDVRGLEKLIDSAKGSQRIRLEEQLQTKLSSLDTLIGRADKTHAGILSPRIAVKVREAKAKVRQLFVPGFRGAQAQNIEDITKTDRSLALFDQSIKDAAMEEDLVLLVRQSGKTIEEVSRRMTQIAEKGHLLGIDTLSMPTIGIAKEFKKISQQARREFTVLDKELRVAGDLERKAILSKMDTIRNKRADDYLRLKSKITERRLDLKGLEKELGPLTTPEIAFYDNYVADFEQWIPKAQALGVPVEKLQSSKGFTRFLPRILTPAAKKLKRKDKALYKLLHSEYTTRTGASIQRKLYPEKDIVAVNKIIKEDYGLLVKKALGKEAAKDFKFFDEDIIRIVSERKADNIRVLNAAAADHAFVGLLGRTGAKGRADEISAASFFEKVKLDPSFAPKDTWIPKELVREITNVDTFIHDVAKNNSLLAEIFQAVDRFNKPFQIGLTSFFPAFHHRNMINNMFVNAIAGVKSSFYVEAMNLQRRIAKGIATTADKKLWRELNQWRAVRGGQFREYEQFVSKGSRFEPFINAPVTEIINKVFGRSKKLKREQFNIGTGRAYGTFIEENARIAHFMSKRADGLSSLEAMKSMNKYLFDPTNMTNFEKTFARPTILFYSWLRNNIPLMLNTVITNPRVGSIYTKITGLGEDETPIYLRRGFPFKAPEFLFGPNQFIGSLGLGIEDLAIANVSSADPSANFIASLDQVQRLADNLISRTSPLIKFPLELLSGRESFSGRDISRRSALDIASGFNPFQRFLRTGEKLLDKESSTVSKFVDLTTGMRLYTSNEKSLRKALAKRKAKATGLFIDFPILIPKDKTNKEAKRIGKELSKILREK